MEMSWYVAYGEWDGGRKELCEDNRGIYAVVPALMELVFLLRSQATPPLKSQEQFQRTL